MIWKIIAIGKPRLPFVTAGVTDYLSRIQRMARCDLHFCPASDPQQESEHLLRASESTYRIVLDEKGKQFSTSEFANYLAQLQLRSVRKVSLLVGGAAGHSATLRNAADTLFALSHLTFQHEIALLIAVEQIYRAYTILGHHPYHRV